MRLVACFLGFGVLTKSIERPTTSVSFCGQCWHSDALRIEAQGLVKAILVIDSKVMD